MEYDLVDEMTWEDLENFLTLEEAGLEQPAYDTVMAAQAEYFKDESK